MDGTIWIRREEVADSRLVQYLVIHPEGRLSGEVAFPLDERVLEANGLSVWVMRSDEAGEETIRSYRLTR
jgi:hypothetical protein